MDSVYNFLMNKVKLNKKDIIVVGVSAGPDSMALLYILNDLRKKIGYKIIVAHVNHNVRKESVEEAEFLKKYCNDADIIFEMMTINKYGDDNFHNEARNIRYNYYDSLIKKYKANYLMTGHHADDLIETILMRIVRGSTLRGYSGFSDIVIKDNYKIVRPLISVTKEELENFDKTNKIPYRVDKSNFKDKYTRNRYRKYVLPFLKSEDNLVHEKFIKFSKQIIETDEYITKIASRDINDIYHDNTLDINKFKELDMVIQKRIIDLIFSELYLDDIIEIDSRHVDLVMNAINSNKTSLSYNLPNDYVVVKEYSKLVFKKDINAILPYDIDKDEIELGEEDFGLFYIDAADNPDKYVGKKIRFKAQAHRPSNYSDKEFVPGRFAMTCCADDIAFIGFKAYYNGAASLNDRDWIIVEGTIGKEYYPEFQGEGPVIKADSVIKTGPAEDDLVYFNY